VCSIIIQVCTSVCCCHVFSFVDVLLQSSDIFGFVSWFHQAVLLISFNTWPIGLPYPAVGTCPKSWYWLLSVAIHGFIGCYGDVRRTDMESLCCRGDIEGRAPRHHLLAITLSRPHYFTSLMILWLWLEAILKSSTLTTQWAPQKWFQSGPALAEAGPGWHTWNTSDTSDTALWLET